MATRIEKLNRLRIASPCGESWDGMAGGAERRHCAECDREVFDFARMTPRQIQVRIAASGGRLCARLTRGADGLVTLPPPEPPPFWLERRASPVASALVTALLGFGGAASGAALEAPASAMPSGPAAASAVTRIDGVVTDQEGESLPGATVTIQEPDGGRELVRVSDAEGSFLGTIEFPYTEPLRRVYGDSELVVIGVVGSTFPSVPENPVVQEIEVRVTSVLKGRFAGRTLLVAKVRDDDEKPLAPGARVLAFLDALTDAPEPGSKVTFAATDSLRDPQALSDDQLSAYTERLLALGRISRRGQPGPEDLAAWLVATVEEPLTRNEATRELSCALASLAEIAEERELSVEHATADFRAEVASGEAEGKKLDGDEALRRAGAFVGEADQSRLIRALLATERLSQGDLELYSIVRPWANDKAVEWLTRRFREVEPEDGEVIRGAMGRLAEGLGSDSLIALLETSEVDLERYLSSRSEEDFNDTDRLDAEVTAWQKELRRRFLRML